MANFTAVLECDMFTYEVKANIDETGVNYLDIYFGDTSLSDDQMIHFINVYGESDLDDEVRTQYDAWVKDQREDKLIEAWEIRQLERGWHE